MENKCPYLTNNSITFSVNKKLYKELECSYGGICYKKWQKRIEKCPEYNSKVGKNNIDILLIRKWFKSK